MARIITISASNTDSSNDRFSPRSSKSKFTTPSPAHTFSVRFTYPFLKKRTIFFCCWRIAGGGSEVEGVGVKGQQERERMEQKYSEDSASAALALA